MNTSPVTRLWRDALARVDEILQQSDGERDVTLATLERTQPELHSLVSSLLRAQHAAETVDFLEPPRANPGTLAEGTMLGPWRVVSRLGEGGMGEVWLARRDDGLYQGEVAIKTLLPHFARGALRERFLREAQLLGRISHPHIARLLDAGVSAQGTLYLVLEYVRGEALDRYCDERRLDVAARLGLFLATCAAVSHAHSHLIVHRDLKPSNILVTPSGEVKLLDFGVATLLETEAPGASDLTRLTGRVFTPEFAAPEQLRGEAITTSTDVYSLGVLLYLLLTGRRPLGTEAENAAALEHAVLTQEAPLPSHAFRAADAETFAALRGGSALRLRRDLAGDLDNIVARALEKRPADRYATVQELAADLERHLKHLPVQARAATWRYRAAKFLRRNRLPVAVGATMLTAVVVGALIALWQANLARVEARKANAIRDFLVGVFERNSVAHADGAAARKTTAEELLAQSAREIRGRLHEAPEVRRELLGVMARLYSSLDLQAPAIELLNDQLELERRTEGPDSVAVARTLAHLAFSQVQTGNYELAEETSRQSLAIFRARGDQRSLEHALAYGNLAQAAYRLARSPDVVRSNYQAGLSLIEKHHPRNHWRMEMMLGLVRADLLAQDYPAAVTHSERALALLDANAVDANGIVRGSVLETLAHSLSWVNRTAEAERLLLEAITEFDRAGGPDHPFAAEARRELGAQYMWAGRRAEARALLGKALPAMEKNKGPDDVELTSHARTTYASTLYLRGELAAAEPHMRQAWRATRGVATLLAPHTDINLLRLSTQRGRFAEAREFARGLEETLIKSFGNGSWMHQTGVARLGEFALAEGRAAEARRLFTRLRDDFPEAPDALTNARAAARAGLVRLALAEGDVTGARTQAAELLADIERARGRGDMPDEEAEARLLLGVALARGGDSAAARAHLERALARREAMDAPESLWLAEIRLQLAQVLVRLGDRAAARREFTLAEEAHRRQGEVGPQYATLLEEVRRALIR